MVIPRDSPHCASSSAAEISLPCVRGSPCGEAKLNRSTVSNMSGAVGVCGACDCEKAGESGNSARSTISMRVPNAST